MTATPALDIRDVACSYGPLQVLFGVSLSVDAGERVALLGTNGAGKSTLLKVVCGLVPADSGSVFYKGEDITRMRPEARVERGISMVAGGRATFPSLTVEENLRIGAYPIRRDRSTVEERLERVLDLFPRLRDRLRQSAGTLSGGEQQMMAIGRSLLASPELLLVDELSLGLAPIVMAEIVAVMEQISTDGTTILLVEQSLNIAVGLTDHGHFMEKGEIRYSGPIAELADRDDLARSVFFGTR